MTVPLITYTCKYALNFNKYVNLLLPLGAIMFCLKSHSHCVSSERKFFYGHYVTSHKYCKSFIQN